MAHYLLPCECGRKLDVTTADAGEKLTCECGRKVEVPTLRGLESLEPVAAATAPAQPTWGARQGLMFLGTSLVVAAVVALIYLYFVQPPTREEVLTEVKQSERVDVDKLTPAGAWLRWDTIRLGLMRQLNMNEAQALRYVVNDTTNWRTWRMIVFVTGGFGVALIVGGYLIPKRSEGRRTQSLAAPARK